VLVPVPVATAISDQLSAVCENYLARVDACVNRLMATNAVAASALKPQTEQTRAAWTQIPDKNALSKACEQASEAFTQLAKEMRC
jgi:uncharacterized protein YcaQ